MVAARAAGGHPALRTRARARQPARRRWSSRRASCPSSTRGCPSTTRTARSWWSRRCSSSAPAAQAVIENLEIAYLANRDPNVGYRAARRLASRRTEPTRPDDGADHRGRGPRHLRAQRALRGRARRAPVPPARPRAPAQRVREPVDGLGAQARRAARARARDARRHRHHLLDQARRAGVPALVRVRHHARRRHRPAARRRAQAHLGDRAPAQPRALASGRAARRRRATA